MKRFLNALPKRTLILIFSLIACFFSVYSYLIYEDRKDMESKIEKRQAELGRIIALRNEYLERKSRSEEKKGKVGHSLTLSTVERIYTGTVKGGRVIVFKPVVEKAEKRATSQAVELRIQGLALQDTLSLIEELERSGFFIRKFQLSLSQSSPNLLDVYLMISDT